MVDAQQRKNKSPYTLKNAFLKHFGVCTKRPSSSGGSTLVLESFSLFLFSLSIAKLISFISVLAVVPSSSSVSVFISILTIVSIVFSRMENFAHTYHAVFDVIKMKESKIAHKLIACTLCVYPGQLPSYAQAMQLSSVFLRSFSVCNIGIVIQ